MPSTMIGCLAGAMSDTDANSAHTVAIRGNHLHDHQGDYPNEDFYDRFDEPAELHSSIISIRGHHFVIEENEMHNIWDTVGIQLYNDDADGVYDLGHITLRHNLIYDIGPNALHIIGDLDGPIIAEYNTIISSHQDPSWPGSVEPCRRFVNPELGITRQTFNIMEMFEGGEGTIIQNNVLVVDVGIANEAYENYDAPTAHWDLSYNFIYRTAHPSGDVAPSNTLVCEQIEGATRPPNSRKTAVFQSPQYQYQHGQRCGPGFACDFTPLPGCPLCTMGSDGNHVGANPCPLEPSP
jgi:hypothetical protein